MVTNRNNIINTFTDDVASSDLRIQMKRYSVDIESAVRTAIDWAIYAFNRLEMSEVVDIIKKEKSNLLADSNDDPLVEADLKSLVQYITWKFKNINYPLTSLTLENHVVNQIGELDEMRFKTISAKRAAQKREAERIIENVDRGEFAEKPTTSILVSKK